ncbi:MAG: hypothetical protein R3F17_13780 [Planctomycetota bacterium]
MLFDRLLNERLPQLYPGDDQSRARERLHHESQVIKELDSSATSSSCGT